jgi:hypothetical protein
MGDEMAKVLRNSNGVIAIELSRTEKRSRCILTMDTCRDVREIPLEEKIALGNGEQRRTIIQKFDQTWHQAPDTEGFDYPVEKAALYWLESRYIPLTPRAKKELVMLVLAFLKENVIGKFADTDTAIAAVPEGTEVVSFPEDLTDLSNSELTRFYNIMVPTEKKITRFANKGEALSRLQQTAEEYANAMPEFAPRTHTPRVEGAVHKIRAIINENLDKPRKDVIQMCVDAGYNKATATTQYGAIHKGGSNMSEGAAVQRNGGVAKAKEIIEANFGAEGLSPKDIIGKCVEAGINKATAQTQYYKHKKAVEAGNTPAAE